MNQPALLRDATIPLPVMLLTTALCGMVGILLEVLAGLSPGYVAVLILSVPVVLTASCHGMTCGAAAGALGAAAVALGAGLAMARADALPAGVWVMPAGGSIGLVGLGIGLGLRCGRLQHRLDEKSVRAHELARQVYHLTREQDEDDTGPDETPTTDRAPAPAASVDYGQLLVKVQDIGKSISSALDLDTLSQMVPRVARKLTGADRCQLYLLDETGHWLAPCVATESTEPLPAEAGLFGWALEHRQVLTRELAAQDYQLRGLLETQPVPCDAVVPLVLGRDVLGLINIAELTKPPAEMERLLRILANFASLGVRNARLFQRIQDMAKRDGLTGLFNHASFQERLHQILEQRGQAAGACAVVLSDVDHFKRFNDTHGHQAGDFVLKRIAEILRELSPADGMAARYGGEEFVLLLPGTPIQEARAVAERYRQTVADAEFRYQGERLHVTASVGVAAAPDHARTASELVQRADEAMYAAKESGRNAVVVAESVPVA